MKFYIGNCKGTIPIASFFVSAATLIILGIGLIGPSVSKAAPNDQASDDQRAAKRKAKTEARKKKAEEKKSLQDRANNLADEAAGLESERKFAEALETYVDAEEIYRTPSATSGRKRLHREIESKIKEHLAKAENALHARNFNEAINNLTRAQELDPARALLEYDLAVVYHARFIAQKYKNASGDQADEFEAVKHLDLCMEMVPPGKQREELEIIRATLVTPSKDETVDGSARDVLLRINKAFSSMGSDEGFRKDAPNTGINPCRELPSTDRFPNLAPLWFNWARCHEWEANYKQAASELGNYLRLSADALDQQQQQTHRRDLDSLSNLPAGKIGEELLSHYASADRFVDKHRYDLALRELAEANDVLPDFPYTVWQIAMLHYQMGQVKETREYLSDYLRISSSPELSGEAVRILASVSHSRTAYDIYVADARQPLAEAVAAFIEFGSRTRAAYIRPRLTRAIENLSKAVNLFPLGGEAQELLAFVYQLAGDFMAVRRSFDIAWSQGFPVRFYLNGFNLLTITKTGFSISQNAKPAEAFAAEPVRPIERMQNAHVERIVVREDTIQLHTKGEDFFVSPARLTAFDPSPNAVTTFGTLSGPIARRYANQYGRLLRRYLGVDDFVPAPEHFTKKEWAIIGVELFEIGMTISDLTNTVKVLDLLNAISWSFQLAQLHGLATDLVKAYQQHRQLVIQQTPFKTFVLKRPKFEFRITP